MQVEETELSKITQQNGGGGGDSGSSGGEGYIP
jgi:hypothetical protein